MRMYQGPLPAPGRLAMRPRRRGGSYHGVGRGHHPPLAWLPPLARAQDHPTITTNNNNNNNTPTATNNNHNTNSECHCIVSVIHASI